MEAVPWCLVPLMRPYKQRVELVLKPGLESLSWNSISIDNYLSSIEEAVQHLARLSKNARDVLECRVENILDDIASTQLCVLLDEPVPVLQFVKLTETQCLEATNKIAKDTANIESSIKELIEALKAPLTEGELERSMNPDPKNKEPDVYTTLLNHFAQKNIDAVLRCTRLSLETMRRRLQSNSTFAAAMRTDTDTAQSTQHPLLMIDVVLAIPRVAIQPSLEECQALVSGAVQTVQHATENVMQWEHVIQLQKKFAKHKSQAHESELPAAAAEAEENKLNLPQFVKPLPKLILEHKDISKVVMQLNSIITTNRLEVNELLTNFTSYEDLWQKEPQDVVAEFVETIPIVSDYETRLHYYKSLEEQINELPSSHHVGPLLLLTDLMKTGLTTETAAWKLAYGRGLNQACGKDIDQILTFFESMQKRLSRPIKDLDDIRAQMATLAEIRQSEIHIDQTIVPIEEAYMILGRYELVFDDGNAERVDSLGYGWKLLQQKRSNGTGNCST
jgi:dynein heavy chain